MDSTRRPPRLIAIATICACLLVTLHGQDASNANAKRVLALHVIRRDSPGFDDTFRSVLREALANRLDYYSEYIDLNRLGDQKYQSALSTYLHSRYVDGGFDLVIASGPAVVDFLNRDPTLFRDVPQEQLRLGARIFATLVAGGYAVGWLMYLAF